MRESRSIRAVLVALVLALAACGDGGPTSSASPTPTTSTATPTEQPTTAQPTEEPTEQTPLIEVRDGRVVGGAPTIEAAMGETVTFRVLSDVADEVHVHGVDHRDGVVAGVESTVEFVAEVPGQFEIELEDAGLLLAELVVR